MRTLTIMILIAMTLGIASAQAGTCTTSCSTDGYGNQICHTHCW